MIWSELPKKTHVASPFKPCARERSPAGFEEVYALAKRSFPRASFAETPPPPPPDPGGRKNAMYGTASPPTVTAAEPSRIRFMVNRRSSSMYNSSAAAILETVKDRASIAMGAKAAEEPAATRLTTIDRSFMMDGMVRMMVMFQRREICQCSADVRLASIQCLSIR